MSKLEFINSTDISECLGNPYAMCKDLNIKKI